MKERIWRYLVPYNSGFFGNFVFLILLGGFFISGDVSAQGGDFEFRQHYEAGRMMLRRKFYRRAVKEFSAAVKTAKGKRHFGAHYYLAVAYFWLPDIEKALKILEEAKGLVKKPAQHKAYTKLLNKINSLYGQLVIVPQVDPDAVGRLLLRLKPKVPFSNRHKRRYYKVFMARLKKMGGLRVTGEPIYLPRGEYEIGLKMNQCLVYGLFDDERVASSISIGSSPVTLNLKAQKSCNCPSNQKIYRDGKKVYCACPKGMGWNKEKRRCEIAKQMTALPWVLAGAGVAVVGGVAAIIIYEVVRDKRRKVFLFGTLGAMKQQP